MLEINKNEPVINNEMLYQRKEGQDSLVLDKSAKIPINYYRFIYEGRESYTEIPNLIEFLRSYL